MTSSGSIAVSPDAADFSSVPKTRMVWGAAMVLCWFLEAVSMRHSLDPDGISYLDIAYSVLQGHWHSLLNAYWSPGDPLLLTAWLKLFKPRPIHEILTVRLLGWLTLVLALAIFDYFLRCFFRLRRSPIAMRGMENAALPTKEFYLLAYSLFFWVTTFQIPAYLDHPDILVAAAYLLASAMAMDFISAKRGYGRYVLFGIVLGIGYIIKVVLFPIGIVFLVALACYRNQRNPRLLVSLLTFALVSAPLAIGLSLTRGRFTLGDSGPIARIQAVGLYDFGNLRPGKPVPAAPHIQAYVGSAWHGTYPAWTDPSTPFTGKVPRIGIERQIHLTHIVLRFYFDLMTVSLGSLTCAFLILLCMERNLREYLRRLLPYAILWLVALAGFGGYALLRTEGRLIAPFVIGLFIGLFGALGAVDITYDPKVSIIVIRAAAILLIAQSVVQVGHIASGLSSPSFPDWQVASTLPTFGVQPGDKISFMGDTLIDHGWAHLARVQIASEIPLKDVQTFWAATDIQKQQAFDELAGSGAKALITRDVPETATPGEWAAIGRTGYYIHEFGESSKVP